MEIKELMNGAVLTYIMQNLQSTATKFFLSSFTNRYIKNPVYEDHYSTFSDVLHDFWVNLPKLVSSLLDNYTEQLKVEAAFLADDSVATKMRHSPMVRLTSSRFRHNFMRSDKRCDR